MKRMLMTACLALAACGDSSGTPATISMLSLAGGPVRIGQVDIGHFVMIDPDGDLAGSKFKLTLTQSQGGASFPTETPIANAVDGHTEVFGVQFMYGLVAPAPPGDYTASVVVVERDDTVSNTLTATVSFVP